MIPPWNRFEYVEKMEKVVGSAGVRAKETVSLPERPCVACQGDDADYTSVGYDEDDETPPDTEEDCGCEDVGEA
jgi:hypothetical protein